jgi:antitoxin VapB
MPLHIRDEQIVALAIELQSLTGARSKTEAVGVALRHEIERIRKRVLLRDRLAAAKAMARQIGPVDPSFDRKAFADSMSDGE